MFSGCAPGKGGGTVKAATSLDDPGTPVAALADRNGDGRMDLVTANWHGNDAGVLMRTT